MHWIVDKYILDLGDGIVQVVCFGGWGPLVGGSLPKADWKYMLNKVLDSRHMHAADIHKAAIPRRG